MKWRLMVVILLAMFASNGLAGAAPGPTQEEFVQTLKALRDPVVGPGSELTQQGDYTGTHFAGDGIALSYKPVFQSSSLRLFWDGTLVFGPFWQQVDGLLAGPEIRLRVRSKVQQVTGIGLRVIGELFNFTKGRWVAFQSCTPTTSYKYCPNILSNEAVEDYLAPVGLTGRYGVQVRIQLRNAVTPTGPDPRFFISDHRGSLVHPF